MAARRKPKATKPRTPTPPTATTPTATAKRVRYGGGVKRLSEAQVKALLNAGWLPPEKKPVGRPKKAIDATMVERLAAMMHTQREIAVLVGCSVDTIADNYSEAYYRGRENGKKSLRAAQMKRALKGSDRMLVWLGVQELGQKSRHELSGDADAPLIFEAVVPGSSLPPASAKEPE